MAQENLFLLHALQMGFFISFLYDILRVYRRLFPHGLFLVSVEDLFFWIYCGAEVFFLMHREGNGNLRWFAVLGAVLGMGAYVRLISPLFLKYSLMILNPAVRFLRKSRRAVSEKTRRFLKNKLTALRGMIKIIVRKCRVRKRGVHDDCGENEQKEAGLGGRSQEKAKGQGQNSPP